MRRLVLLSPGVVMSSLHYCRSWLVLALLLPLAIAPTPIWADDAAEELEPAIPFVILNVASVDNALTDIAWMFDSIQRSDMKDVVDGYLSQAKDLTGVDRTRPFGMAVFLDTAALPPRPAFVQYVPIANLEEALKTITAAPVTVRKSADREDEYDVLQANDGGNVVAVARLIGSYAYLAPNDQKDILDILPDMEQLTQGLASRYDVAITAQIKAIPQGVRQVFVNFLRTQAEIDLQRKDEEPEAAYLVRRSQGMNALEFIEQIALQGEDLTIGWNSQPEQHQGYFEGTLNATPDSEFAKYLTEVAAKPSMFTPLRNEDRPLTINISWAMNKREKAATTGLLQALRVKLAEELPEMAEQGGAIEQLYDPLLATVEAGHIDLYFQFAATDAQKFVFQGGLKLAGAQSFGAGLERFLQGIVVKIQERSATNPTLETTAPTIVLNAELHQNVTLHKITPQRVPDGEMRLYGGVPDIFLGTSSRAFWFAVGGTEALPTLKSSIDTLLTTAPAERAAGGNVPVSVTVRVAPWLELPLPEKPDLTGLSEDEQRQNRRRVRRAEQAAQNREMANEAFGPSDGIRIDGRPSESGFRTRITLDEGFVKLLGLLLAREYDRSQL
ncbi:MAG: hypothetical protein ACK5Q5_22335 [Planctomycetaceae bacterium]